MNINLMTTVGASALTSAVIAGAVVGFVNLQDVSPGTPDAGHINVTGNAIAGKFGSGVTPTLARMQVKETGALQGMRSESGTGVAVFGKSTAASGLGAGGYFTTSSVGGRGIVGDALSGTGNTVGGLFYNRSAGAGVGVWGRAIGAGSTATGVFGETLSATGTALAATNSGSGNSLTAGTQDDSLQTVGTLPRHDYGTTTAAMVPIAYGFVAGNGSPFHLGSGNWTSVKDAFGSYSIDISGVTLSEGTFVVVATPFEIGGEETAAQKFASGSNDVGIDIRDNASGTLTDSDFQFVVYRATGLGAGPPAGLEAELRRKGGSEAWAKRDPKGFETWRKKYVAWQREAMRSKPYQAPVDETNHP